MGFVAFLIVVAAVALFIWKCIDTTHRKGPKRICRRDLRDLKHDIRLWQAGVRPKLTDGEDR